MNNFLKKAILRTKTFFTNSNYEKRIKNELNFYNDCLNVHELPEIFHYWSNKYLLPKQLPFGFTNPDDFFIVKCSEYCLVNNRLENIKILSIGSGNGELEVKIAAELSKRHINNFSVECMDINNIMLERSLQLAKENNVDSYITTRVADFNKWKPEKKEQYDIIIANQSLHHVVELEHLFNSIHRGLKTSGKFLTSDMIGRNGHMRWPEALEALKPFWNELDKKHKYNRMLKRQEDEYINHDCSTSGFEGIRAQDILSLLNKKFHFELFIPFANIIMVFIDRPFGHNFDTQNPKDLDFIDRVHKKDEELMLKGVIKPTQMLSILTKDHINKTQLVNTILTPEFCIRKTSTYS